MNTVIMKNISAIIKCTVSICCKTACQCTVLDSAKTYEQRYNGVLVVVLCSYSLSSPISGVYANSRVCASVSLYELVASQPIMILDTLWRAWF